jgi:hypothetical protein
MGPYTRPMAWLLSVSSLGVVVALASVVPASAQSAPASESPRPTRLFIGPTARPLPKGEGYFVLHGALVPSFQVGVTDRVSVGAGTFYFSGGSLWVTPKVQVLSRGATSVSGTLVHFIVPGEGALGFAFGSVTHDRPGGGITAGLGVAYASGWGDDHDWAHSGPLLMFGGDSRISRRVTFVNENYIIASGDGAALLMGGVRTAWGRFELDTGVVVIAGGGLFAAPVLNLAWSF